MFDVGVIGLGVGEQHARYIAAHKDCRLVTLCDLDVGKAENLAQELCASHVTDIWQSAIKDPAIDIISIASFDHHHAEQVVMALQAGKHIFVEKPLCTTRAQFEVICTLWRTTGRHIISNLPLRAAPLFGWLKAEITRGVFGEIYAIDGEYLYGRVEKITKGWRKDVPDYSVIEGGGIHLLDLILYVTGQYPVKVASVGNKIVTRDTDFRYADYAASTFMFESGMIARLTSNFGCVHPHQHVLKIFGTKATFILDDCGARLQTYRDPYNRDDYSRQSGAKKPEAEDIIHNSKPNSKAELFGVLVEAIKGAWNKELTLHEFRLMNACLSAVEALDSGKTEDIGTVNE